MFTHFAPKTLWAYVSVTFGVPRTPTTLAGKRSRGSRKSTTGLKLSDACQCEIEMWETQKNPESPSKNYRNNP